MGGDIHHLCRGVLVLRKALTGGREMEQYISHLKKYRQLAELTQEKLANKVGVRRETIIRLESAKYNPSLKLAIDISRVVGAPIEEIFEFPEETVF
jgi:DNA-binding XRE family transcriptional regulator